MRKLFIRSKSVSWYGRQPASNTTTTQRTTAVVQSPIYRGTGVVKPYDIELNLDMSTIVNGGHFALM